MQTDLHDQKPGDWKKEENLESSGVAGTVSGTSEQSDCGEGGRESNRSTLF